MVGSILGQIGLIPGGAGGWVQWGICKVTRSKIAHVIVCTGEDECAGAEPGGVRLRPLSHYPTAVWSKFDLSEEQAARSAAYARAAEGHPYAFLDDAIIALEHLLDIRLPGARGRRNRKRTYECAQLADAALSEGAGIMVFHDGRRPGTVYPGSFEHLFIRRGWVAPDFFTKYEVSWRRS